MPGVQPTFRKAAVFASLLTEQRRVRRSDVAPFLREVAVEGLSAQIDRARKPTMDALESESEAFRAREGLLALWLLHTADPEAGFGPMAASWSVKYEGSTGTAVRLWLMERDNTDPEVALILLDALREEVATRGAWNHALSGAVIGFVRSSLAARARTVRDALLSLLFQAARAGALPHSLPPQFAVWLANALPVSMKDVAANRYQDVREVEIALLQPKNISALPLSPRALERIILDLLDAQDHLGALASPIATLVDQVRRRQLLDDAGRQAMKGGAPVQTLRFLSDRASTRVVQAFVSFGEAIVGATRDPDFAEVAGRDYGTEVGWAPAASVPFHLYFGAEESRRAFDVLKALVAARGSAERDAVIETLEPVIADAIYRFLTRLTLDEGEIELVLTDPASPEWQRTLFVGTKSITLALQKGLSLRGSAKLPGQRIIVPKEYVPQANGVRQVLQAVDAMMQRGAVTMADIDGLNSDRQVNYYKHGARVLGLFDDDNQPTGRADALVGLPEDKRLALTAVFFEDSPIGRAWRTWAGKDKLTEVDPDTAKDFLEACVVGLTRTTPTRRASTLRTWFSELMPNYPG